MPDTPRLLKAPLHGVRLTASVDLGAARLHVPDPLEVGHLERSYLTWGERLHGPVPLATIDAPGEADEVLLAHLEGLVAALRLHHPGRFIDPALVHRTFVEGSLVQRLAGPYIQGAKGLPFPDPVVVGPDDTDALRHLARLHAVTRDGPAWEPYRIAMRFYAEAEAPALADGDRATLCHTALETLFSGGTAFAERVAWAAGHGGRPNDDLSRRLGPEGPLRRLRNDLAHGNPGADDLSDDLVALRDATRRALACLLRHRDQEDPDAPGTAGFVALLDRARTGDRAAGAALASIQAPPGASTDPTEAA